MTPHRQRRGREGGLPGSQGHGRGQGNGAFFEGDGARGRARARGRRGTVAVKVTTCPKTDGLLVELTVVVLESWLTTWGEVSVPDEA